MAAKLAAGTLSPERAAVAPQLILGQRIDAALALLFAILLWIVIVDMLRVALRFSKGESTLPLAESQYVATRLEGGMASGGLHA